MKGLANKFLTYFPFAALGLIIPAAGVWAGLANRIAAVTASIIIALQNPWIAVGALLIFGAWIGGIIWTHEGSAAEAELKLKAKAELARKRSFIVGVGRALSRGYSQSTDDRTLLAFMQADGGYARIRPHLSKTFAARLLNQDADRSVMADALLDEMDRIERRWKLI
ncbi:MULTISPECIES: hypothetical protein [unclassified Sphingobium]|uniref:hypothetical protein n=1 Tax=unclassified Sphingobium TaxID=2611147 RepID=UPI0022258417|nr:MULTISPECIES: hypothetical protein [unclassified Sphingobium]MCW2412958.1 hypothetical protein [Sphingobium sp. B8D3D]MCW2414742.1 hypothetical protein [Sphingobium sp. B8D3A]